MSGPSKCADYSTGHFHFKVLRLSFITINYAREVSFYGIIGAARICDMIVWGRAGNQIQ